MLTAALFLTSVVLCWFFVIAWDRDKADERWDNVKEKLHIPDDTVLDKAHDYIQNHVNPNKAD